MELLLFVCAQHMCSDDRLLAEACLRFHGFRRILVAWELHKYVIGTDGTVFAKMAGAGGRVHYHAVTLEQLALCRLLSCPSSS